MTISYSIPGNERRLYAIGLTIAVHLALIYGWQMTRRIPAPEWELPRNAIQWLRLKPLVPPKPVAPRPAAPPPRQQTPRTAPASASPAPTPAPVQPAPAVEAPAARSAHDMLQQAKRDVGKIDKDLRKAYPGQPISAPVQTAQTRLEKGIAAAADAAPNRWFEAPKVTEIIDPGGYGRRRYRVVGANGTYCITVESNHAPDGLDTMKYGIQQKITTCEENEQAPTSQKW
jgi:hypothetical protein